MNKKILLSLIVFLVLVFGSTSVFAECTLPGCGCITAKCGSADGSSFYSEPIQLCGVGSDPGMVFTTSTGWSWICYLEEGLGGNDYVNCSATKIISNPPVNGACGSSNGQTLSTKPISGLCNSGTASIVSGTGPWNWSCTGSNGGTTAYCSAQKTPTAVNGSCGSSNGQTLSTKPTTGLCSAGTASIVSGTGPWNWSCAGVNGGTTAYCSASKTVPVCVTYPGFGMSELISNNLPDSIEFWATAYCPGSGTPYDYPVPAGYTVASCTYGTMGSHCGCPDCVMIDIKLIKTPTPVNGQCGSSNGQTLSSKPTTGLCNSGTASIVSGTGPWNWSCTGSNGGSTAYCSAQKTPDPVNGQCGSSNGQTLSSKPITGLCNSGTASSVSGTGPWSWSCAGSNGGSTAYCSAQKTPDPINGQCGSSNGQTLSSKPTTGLCSAGTTLTVEGYGPWTWTCYGSNGGTNASCIAYKVNIINGQCGPSNGQSFSTKPTTGLCNYGTASSVSGTGPWTWSCAGSGCGSTTAYCSAQKIPDPINGQCGPSNGQTLSSKPITGLCNSGTASSVSGTGPWNWSCTGSNGGSTSYCSAQKTPDVINGQCGDSNGQYFSSKPTTGLCNSGTASSVSGTGPWNWSCTGANGGSTAYCSAQKTADPVNGQCGSSNGQYFSSKPTTGLCNSGTASSVSGTGPWNWSCAGSNGGSTDYCSAQKTADPINAVCGPANGQYFSSKPTTGLCSVGTALVVEGFGPWTWTCYGQNMGSNAYCSAQKIADPVNGQCGDSNGQYFSSKPTTGLCNSGTASSVSGTGPWNWSCTGSNGGSTDYCSAQKTADPVNGQCGDSNGQYFSSKPTTELCNYGTASTVYGTGPWNWSCTGVNGGSTAYCSAQKTADPVNGQCGDSNGQYFSAKPTTGLCNSGTASSVSGTGPWNWSCTGSNGGSTSYCSAQKTADPVNGQCGDSNGQYFSSKPTTGLCNSGTASSVSGTGPWNWSCTGSNGGSTSYCSAQKTADPVNGQCGSSNGQYFSSKPTTELCNYGTASTVYGTGPWNWSCVGVNGGSTDYCSAQKTADPINAVCGPANGQYFSSKPTTNLCSAGTVIAVEGFGPWTWTCYGQNMGSNAYCSAQIAPINGQCGPTNGQTLDSKPNSGLCNYGTASIVSGNGPWSWYCAGSNGGSTDYCSAQITPTNGQCGSSNGQTLGSKPTTGLCNYGTASIVSGYGPWSWYCAGSNGGSTDYCSAQKTADPINAVCGSSNGQSFITKPVINLCNVGTTTGAQGSGPWYWTCVGSNGGSSVDCQANKTNDPINGSCGSSNGQSFISAPTYNLCNQGDTTNFYGSGPWYWTCVGQYGGSNAQCSANKTIIQNPINGSCGSSNGQSFISAPTYNLCNQGDTNNFYGSGPWYWTCVGQDGGSNVQCSANKTAVQNPINGSCGSSNGQSFISTPTYNLCNQGDTNNFYGSGPWYWTCAGQYGGSNVQCSANKTAVQNPINGQCGFSSGKQFPYLPNTGLCDVGVSTGVVEIGNSWVWTCLGFAGGNSVQCNAYRTIIQNPINGQCGSANGQQVSYAPTVGLCNVGANTSVINTGNSWTWTCMGTLGGANSQCSAYRYVAPINTCLSFSYSSWGACQSSGMQYRNVIASYPNGCIDGNPITSQSCTYIPPTCATCQQPACTTCQQPTCTTCQQPVVPVIAVPRGINLIITGRNLTQNGPITTGIVLAKPGDEVEVTITISATDNSALQNVVLNNLLSGKYDNISNVRLNGKLYSGEVNGNISFGNIAANQSKTLMFNLRTSKEDCNVLNLANVIDNGQASAKSLESVSGSLTIDFNATVVPEVIEEDKESEEGMASVGIFAGGWWNILWLLIGLIVGLIIFLILYLIAKKMSERREYQQVGIPVSKDRYFSIQQ